MLDPKQLDRGSPGGLWRIRRVGLALILAATVQANLQAPASGAPEDDQPGGARVIEAGEVHLESSRVYVHVDKTGLGHEHAIVGQLRSGSLRLDESAGQLVFDMASFEADSDAARKYIGLSGTTNASTRQQVTANMRGPDVLDVQRFPTAIFRVKRIERLEQPSRRGFTQYQIDGDFTLHGLTRPVRVMADVEPRDGWLHVRGGFTIQQTQFGIRPYKKAFGAVGVADELQIWGDFWVAASRIKTP